MEEIVKYIVDKLVDNHEAVKVETAEKGDDVTITVTVAKQDMGKVIVQMKEKYSGQVDMSKVSGKIKELLG